MFGFEQWDGAGSLIAEFMLSVVVVLAIVLIVNRVNRNQVPPQARDQQAPGATNGPSATEPALTRADTEPPAAMACSVDEGDPKT